MRLFCFLFCFSLSQAYCQIGLDVRCKNEGNSTIRITVKDSSDYVDLIDESSPSSFDIVFKNDTLYSMDFKYQVFGLVRVPEKEFIEKKEAAILRSGNNISIYLKYHNSYYGDKFYSLSGTLGKANASGEQVFIPNGTNVVQSKTFIQVYMVSPKGITKNGLELKR